MARVNKRHDILEAIVAIIERDGLTAVTLDAVAAETGMTRAGLLYHFPSREALIRATHDHLTQEWERALAEHSGKPANEISEFERYSAYVHVCVNAARRVELILMLEGDRGSDQGNVWQHVLDRWAPPAPNSEDIEGIDMFIARLAADGLWMHEAISDQSLSKELKNNVIKRLAYLLKTDLGN